MPLKVKPLLIEEFVDCLETRPGYSFARYGDGTFLGMRGIEGVNCDGSPIRFDQTRALESSIRDTSITHGMGDLALTVAKADQWLEEKGIDIEWYDCNVMHTASVQGRLYPFIKFLRKSKPVLLGPRHIRQLKGIPILDFLQVHPTEAFYEVPRLEKSTVRVVQRHNANVVLISAGTAAPVLVSRLHKILPKINIIDAGSLWDPYVGVLSRKVFRVLGYEGIRNLRIKNFR